MIECRRLDRLELTRKKFAKNLQHEWAHDEWTHIAPTRDEFIRDKFTRVEPIRDKFTRVEPIRVELKTRVERRNDEEWDGKHCPLCGKDLDVSGRHVSACIMCECGWSKC